MIKQMFNKKYKPLFNKIMKPNLHRVVKFKTQLINKKKITKFFRMKQSLNKMKIKLIQNQSHKSLPKKCQRSK